MAVGMSLIWQPPVIGVKRKLIEAFGETANEVVKRRGSLIQGKFGQLDVFRHLFAELGQTCGYCWVYMVEGENHVHEPWDCPQMLKHNRRDEFRRFKRSISYQGAAPRPCYQCHIVSGGQDALHAPMIAGMGKSNCEYPNLVLGLAYAIWRAEKLHREAEEYLEPNKDNHSWEGIEQFAAWMSVRSPRQNMWPSMRILRWVAKYMVDVSQ